MKITIDNCQLIAYTLNMYLTNKIRATSTYKGKTKFDFFNLIEEGDIIELKFPLVPAGRNGSKLYASSVFFRNERLRANFEASVDLSCRYLSNFEFEEVTNDK